MSKTGNRAAVLAGTALLLLAGCNPYEGVADRNKRYEAEKAHAAAKAQKEKERLQQRELEWNQKYARQTARTTLPDGTRIEQGAETHGLSEDVIRFVLAQVVGSGYRCDSISNVRPLIVKSGAQMRCNQYRYTYSVEDRGGRWVVTVE